MTRCRNVLSTAVVASAVLLASPLVLYPTPAAAEADGPDYYRVTAVAADDALNIRAEPNAHAAVVGRIPANADCVRNLGCRGGLTFTEFSTLSKAEQAERLRENPRWCRVEYQGVTGWVAGRYVAEGSCAQ